MFCNLWVICSVAVWWANGDLLQEDLCHMQQLPSLLELWSSTHRAPVPLLTCASTGDTQTLKVRSGSVSCGVSESWCARGLVWALQAYLVGMGFEFKHDFTPPTILLVLLLCHWTWGIFFFFFWWDPTFSCRWLFSSKLQFWSSRRRRWVHILLLHHLTTFRCTDVWNSPASYCAAKRHLCWVVDALLVVDWREETKVTFYSAMFLTSPLFLFFLIAYFLQQACITHAATELLNSFIF